MIGTIRSVLAFSAVAVALVIIGPLFGKEGVTAEQVISELFGSRAFVLLLVGFGILMAITFFKNILVVVVGLALAISMMVFAKQSVNSMDFADILQKKVIPCTGQASIEIIKSGGDYLAKVINREDGSSFTSPVRLDGDNYSVIDQNGAPVHIPGCQG